MSETKTNPPIPESRQMTAEDRPCPSCGQLDNDHRAHCPEDVEAIKKALLALPPHKERPPQAYRYE